MKKERKSSSKERGNFRLVGATSDEPFENNDVGETNASPLLRQTEIL